MTRTPRPAPPIALSAWERASRERTNFEALAPEVRTRIAYSRLLDAFRAVYHDNPADRHAPEAVSAVAELLAEEARQFADRRLSLAAIGQDEFLRAEYPESSLRAPALLHEGAVAADDLHDARLARQKFGLLLKEAPHSRAAEEARTRLAGGRAARSPEAPAEPSTLPRDGSEASASNERAPDAAGERAVADGTGAAAARVKTLAAVTGIRHWSTPTYTRVAIDLGEEVRFEAARVPHPDRIFFDLHGARLGAELAGKTFTIIDDGFLKRIRAAQATGDTTRVVLDVNDVTEYTAFLLPNPYRLIIDIHGAAKDGTATSAPPNTSAPANRSAPAKLHGEALAADLEAGATPLAPLAEPTASAAANVSGLPAMAPTDGSQPTGNPLSSSSASTPKIARPARLPAAHPVPNSVVTKDLGASTEVAAVSELPGKVEATGAPGTRPIAVVTLGRDPANAPAAAHRRPVRTPDPAPLAAAPAKAADRTADGETSMIRALGLRIGRIVIDAGHGGHDSGTLGVDGIEEKDVVLDVALRLGKLLQQRLGAEIVYTRSDDTFIPLETRTAIANKAQADLFLSIHANSSADASARGVETYYLNFTSDSAALDVAARENAVSGQSVHQLSDLVKKITLKDKIAESREFAQDVEGSLFAGLTKGNDGLRNRGVKKAPFVVLIGANMPSILAEISFVTNPRDAAQLHEPEYRERVAESLYAGVARYENGLAGSRTSLSERASAQ